MMIVVIVVIAVVEGGENKTEKQRETHTSGVISSFSTSNVSVEAGSTFCYMWVEGEGKRCEEKKKEKKKKKRNIQQRLHLLLVPTQINKKRETKRSK